MTSNPWQDLGYAIRQARLGRGWNLEKTAEEVLDNGARRGYVSQVEKGLRTLSAETIDKFAETLDLPDDVVKAAHLAPPVPKEDPKKTKGKAPPPAKPVEDIDRDAERLLVLNARDETAPQVAEVLLTTLAYEFAKGDYRDHYTAYIALRKALEAAEAIRKRGEMPPEGNTGSQLNAVMAEVDKLNAQGELDEADALLDAEERRMREAHRADAERHAEQRRQMLEQRLNQDRLRNAPAAAAARLIADLRQQQNIGKLFWAIDDLSGEWRDAGDKAGDMFALRVALGLARDNWKRSKGKRELEGAALYRLGWGYLRIAERSSRTGDLELAQNAFETSAKRFSKTKQPDAWATSQGGLGVVLQEIGRRTRDPDLLRKAAALHRAALRAVSDDVKEGWNNLGTALRALAEFSQDPAPLDEAVAAFTTALSLKDKQADPVNWETTQMNLALALRWQGALTGDLARLTEARSGYTACEALDIRDKAPFNWAMLQWNIADLALARFHLDPDPALLDEAETCVTRARDIFVDGSDYQTERCDELLTKIEAARAG